MRCKISCTKDDLVKGSLGRRCTKKWIVILHALMSVPHTPSFSPKSTPGRSLEIKKFKASPVNNYLIPPLCLKSSQVFSQPAVMEGLQSYAHCPATFMGSDRGCTALDRTASVGPTSPYHNVNAKSLGRHPEPLDYSFSRCICYL